MEIPVSSRRPCITLRLLLVSLTLLISLVSVAEDFTAQVIAVTDGDTVRVLRAPNTQIKIRMSEIDAPEKAQPWGQRSKEALSGLVYRQTVTVEVATTDRYGRTVAKSIRDDGLDVNA